MLIKIHPFYTNFISFAVLLNSKLFRVISTTQVER